MKVVGFTFIKDAIKMQYPIAEAINSILPLCITVYVAVGSGNDGTRELIASLSSKIIIIDTEWNYTLKANGKVLAAETDKAFAAIPDDADWCIYIQGDEVLHQDGFLALQEAMKLYKNNKNVDGLLLNYRHFFGSYKYVGIEAHWYRHEIRVIKNNKKIYSYRDAQGFRKNDNQKLRVKAVDAHIHHYGWVLSPKIMKLKHALKNKIYHNQAYDETNIILPTDFAEFAPKALAEYTHTHPQVMKNKIAEADWDFYFDTTKNKVTFKDHFKNITEKIFGIRLFDYRNYKKV